MLIFAIRKESYKMKKLSQIIMVLLAVMVVAGCGEKKKSDDIIVKKVEEPKPQGPIKMQEYRQIKDIEWLGRDYQVEIVRLPDDSLRVVDRSSLITVSPFVFFVAMVVCSSVVALPRLPLTAIWMMTIVKLVLPRDWCLIRLRVISCISPPAFVIPRRMSISPLSSPSAT